SGIIAAIATVFARYLAFFVPLSDLGLRVAAVGLVVALSVVNYIGVQYGGLVQNVFTSAKVLAILAIVGAGLLLSRSDAIALPAGVEAVTADGFLLAIAAGLFAYGGWHMVTYTAGETKDAARTIPRALLIGTLIVTACYAGLNAIYLRVLPLEA